MKNLYKNFLANCNNIYLSYYVLDWVNDASVREQLVFHVA